MFDIGIRIPQIGQYIMFAIGGLLVLVGLIIPIIQLNSNRKVHKRKINQEEVFKKPLNEMEKTIEEKSRKRRSSKY